MFINDPHSDLLDPAPHKWWNQLRQGEKGGLELIYSFYVDDMYRFGMAIKSNRALIKDCIQEIFVSLWKYRTNLKDTENVRLYLFRSLSNKIHREVGAHLSKYHEESAEHFDYLHTVESYEQRWIQDQGIEISRNKLKLALEKLPLRQKELIQLLYFENLPYEEISFTMNLHIKSVYTLAWKAINNLKKSMK